MGLVDQRRALGKGKREAFRLSEREFREFIFDGGLFYLGVFGSKSLQK